MAERRRRPDVRGTELMGGVEKRELVIVDYEPQWPRRYRQKQVKVQAALAGAGVGAVAHHIGSTSVPGLAAKPIIDILVTVPDVTAEEDYLPHLLDAGYLLRVREPGHRLVRTTALDVHVHILEVGDPAAPAYLSLRDRLRNNPADRKLYQDTKRTLASCDWPGMNA